MSEAATSAELKEAFDVHARETEEQARRVKQALAILAFPPEQKLCVGLQGLFDEGWQVIDDSEEGSAQRDVALIIAAQKVEHYEIACYGSLITLAKTLRQTEIAELFRPTLDEEKRTDELLTRIAEAAANKEAATESAEV